MKALIPELPPGCTTADIEAAYAQGLLRKTELEHGRYYRGTCRNAQVARWHAGAQKFVYMYREYGVLTVDAIRHAADEARYDVFLAVEETEPSTQQLVPDDEFDRFGSNSLPG